MESLKKKISKLCRSYGVFKSEEISVDELSEKVKRATHLIRICKLKLTSTEEDVNKILKDLETSDET